MLKSIFFIVMKISYCLTGPWLILLLSRILVLIWLVTTIIYATFLLLKGMFRQD